MNSMQRKTIILALVASSLWMSNATLLTPAAGASAAPSSQQECQVDTSNLPWWDRVIIFFFPPKCAE